MNKELASLWSKLRAENYHALTAWMAAKSILRFKELEEEGRVRLRCEPELENYFSTYGEPEGYTNTNGKRVSAKEERAELVRIMDRDGLWWLCSEVWDGEEWQHSDSIGMCMGYKDPLNLFENCYVPDLMGSAVDAWEKMESDRRTELERVHEAACRGIVTV